MLWLLSSSIHPIFTALLPLEPVADDGTDNAVGPLGVVGGVLFREDHVENRSKNSERDNDLRRCHEAAVKLVLTTLLHDYDKITCTQRPLPAQ